MFLYVRFEAIYDLFEEAPECHKTNMKGSQKKALKEEKKTDDERGKGLS